MMTIMEKASCKCPIMNVGSNEAVLINELAEKVSRHFNVNVNSSPLNNLHIDRYIPSIDRGLMIGCPKPIDLNSALKATIKNILASRL
jgi:hypothetical protein